MRRRFAAVKYRILPNQSSTIPVPVAVPVPLQTMKSLLNGIFIAVVLLSCGLLATVEEVHRVGGGSGILHKKYTKKQNKLEAKMDTRQKNINSVMDNEDVVFWTRLLEEGNTRGKETNPPEMSMPDIDHPAPVR